LTQQAKSQYGVSIFSIISLGIITGFIYGLVKALLHISNNRYISFKLYNISLLAVQDNINRYTLIFAILAVLLLVIPWIFFNWIKTNCIEFKILDSNNFRAVLYSLYGVILAVALVYLFYPNLMSIVESNSVLTKLSNSFNLEVELLSILIIAISFLAIIILCSLILSKININTPTKKILYAVISSRGTRAVSVGILLILVLFNISVYGYHKLSLKEGPNVVLITIDTLRADHLGSYGYKRVTSPSIDHLAKKGVVFDNAYSQAPWTLTAMTSIHTSLYPSQHGVIDYNIRINDKFLTIAEFLRNYQYKTIGVISMPFVNSKYGFSQGFEIFNEEHVSDLNDISSHLVTQEAVDYLDSNQENKFFLWVHYFDPHGSYRDHKKFDFTSDYKGTLPGSVDPSILNFIPDNLTNEDVQYIRNLYDEEIAFTDMNIGKLLQKLSDLGLEDNTIIIITADHGEEFLERGGFGHRKLLYNELIRVPLIIYSPIDKKLNGIRNKNNIESRSIGKTIVELIELPGNPFGGENLLSKENFEPNGGYVFSNVYLKNNILKESAITDNIKLIRNYDTNISELYDLYTDQKEKNNIYDSAEVNISSYQKELSTKIDDRQQSSADTLHEVDLNPDEIKRLKALGYLQ